MPTPRKRKQRHRGSEREMKQFWLKAVAVRVRDGKKETPEIVHTGHVGMLPGSRAAWIHSARNRSDEESKKGERDRERVRDGKKD